MADPLAVPLSRLFIVCGRAVEEETLRVAFSDYGSVQHIKVIKDKGVAYVKFDKASSAAAAMEALNGAVLNNGRGPKLKVLLAEEPTQRGAPPPAPRIPDEVLASDPDNMPPRSRLFVVVPKAAEAQVIMDEVGRLGGEGLEYVKTDLIASKGVVFLKYGRASAALRLLEEVGAKGTLGPYKVKIMLAEPKTKRSAAAAAALGVAAAGLPGASAAAGLRALEGLGLQHIGLQHAALLAQQVGAAAGLGWAGARGPAAEQHALPSRLLHATRPTRRHGPHGSTLSPTPRTPHRLTPPAARTPHHPPPRDLGKGWAGRPLWPGRHGGRWRRRPGRGGGVPPPGGDGGQRRAGRRCGGAPRGGRGRGGGGGGGRQPAGGGPARAAAVWRRHGAGQPGEQRPGPGARRAGR
ncbi:MAG: hypothetical protein J3K34DRAFT_233575 [Monoraphidium minutum]|nr:MAG: hypothetical protein J3K34DRAFT_233575 [Monoraphidium minutum]